MSAEDEIQAACVTWFRLQYPHLTLFAIPNGGQRNAITGALMKKTGTLAGVADLFLCLSNGFRHGLFIEMKTPKGRQQPSQREFGKAVTEKDYGYVVCTSFDDFRRLIEAYVEGGVYW